MRERLKTSPLNCFCARLFDDCDRIHSARARLLIAVISSVALRAEAISAITHIRLHARRQAKTMTTRFATAARRLDDAVFRKLTNLAIRNADHCCDLLRRQQHVRSEINSVLHRICRVIA
jgi:hypothetical protein